MLGLSRWNSFTSVYFLYDDRENSSLELKRRKHRRGTQVHAEPWHANRPADFGRRYGRGVVPDDELDQTPSKPFDRDEFLSSLNLGETPPPITINWRAT